MKDNEMLQVSATVIETKIFLVRGKKVMLDRNLAELHGVETKPSNYFGNRWLCKTFISALDNFGKISHRFTHQSNRVGLF